jgi:RHS repeat-associated protein
VRRARSRWAVLVLASVAALLFVFLPFSLEPSDPETIDALAPVEILAEGFQEPIGVAVDPNGAVLVSDREDGRVLKISGGRVEPLVSNLRGPVGLAFDTAGRLIIVEEKSGQLLRLEDDGRLSILAEGMNGPRWVAPARNGTMYISAKGLRFRSEKKGEDDDDGDDEGGRQVILRLTPSRELNVFAEGLRKVEGIIVHEGTLFASAGGLKEKEEDGGIFEIPIHADGTAGPLTSFSRGKVKKPAGLVRDRLGALYISAEEFTEGKKIAKGAIGKVAPEGVLSRFASKLQNPRGLAFDNHGNLYVADNPGGKKGRVIRFGAPPPPTVVFPSFTNRSPLALNGTSEARSRIDAFLNDSANPITLSTPDGSFDLSWDLTLNTENSLEVFTTAQDGLGLSGAPAQLTIVHDGIAPSITAFEPTSGSYLNSRTPLIRASFSDAGSGVDGAKVEISLDTTPASAQTTAGGFTLIPNPLPEGPHSVSVTIFDRAANSASAATAFTVDVTAPLLADLSPADGSALNSDRPLIRAEFSDNFAIDPASVRVLLDGADLTAEASISSGGFTLDPSNPLTLNPFSLSQGPHTLIVSVADLAGNSASDKSTFTVTTGPEIVAFLPASGAAGSEVTIQGKGFEPASGNTTVRFGGVRASTTALTQSAIRAIVPIGASTGRITVETASGIGMGSEDFIVLLRQDFALFGTPEVGFGVPGSSVSYAVQVLSAGPEPFTGLAALSVDGLPAGVSAAITPPHLGSKTTAILTLTPSISTAPGSYPIEVRASAQVEGRAVTRAATLTLAVQAPGQTVLAGQIRDENERPLSGVSIKLGGAAISDLGVSDGGGNFFIPLSVSGLQVFLIDGSTANTPTVNYPTIPVTLDIDPGAVNTFGFTPRLHGQPIAKLLPITPGEGKTLTHPDLPGFTMTIPSGVEIIGWDGKPNTQFSVTAVPIDRSPLPPLPAGLSASQIYLFSFGKIGGGIPTGNVFIDTPNDVGGLSGEKVELYFFDEAPDGTAPNQWKRYGTGTISADGARIITDINPDTKLPYGIPRFCCGARVNVPPPPPPRPGGGPSGGPSGSGKTDGEPVDTATGFFYLDKTDLVLPGILPIAVTRTYRTNLANAGPFGLGTSWPYDIFLQPPPNSSPDALILFTPGNRQDLFSRQADGSFENTTSPPLGGAIVTVASGIRSLRFKDGTLWRFDPAGRLISQADRNGNALTLIRDGQGRVIAISEPSGRQLTVSYVGATLRISSIRDPVGREVRYGYDGAGRLTTVTDAGGGMTRYAYDDANRMVSITDPRNITFLINEYDDAGRVIRQIQADGGIWTFSYTATGSFISQSTVTNPNGYSTTYRFNAVGYLISQTDALGQTTVLEREAGSNLLLATTDPLGRRTSFTYDAAGNVTSITDPAGNVRSFEYEPIFSKLTSIIDPLGNVTRFEYDARGNLTATADPTGARTTIVYNFFGQPESSTDPLGNTTAFSYDDFGNLATITDPLENRTQRSYDSVSRLIEQTDPRGRSTGFSYDGLNRITQIVDALNGITAFSYDGNGNLLTVTDARGSTIAHTYDRMDRPASRTDPVGTIESFIYDSVGNLTRHTDRKGQVSTFNYDALNRRTSGTYADGATTRFVFDGAGRLIESTDSVGGTVLNSYDALDRLVAETTALGTVSYQYDALGRRARMDVPGQLPVIYSYDTTSRVRQIVQGSQVVDLAYDALGRRTRITLPNGVSTEYQYDAASRLAALIYQNALGVLGNLTYQYDPAGNRVAVGGSFARTLLPDPLASTTYDAANRQLAFGDKQMTYDANGNVTTLADLSGVTDFIWDSRNRLSGIRGSLGNTMYTYDALGRRSASPLGSASGTWQYDRSRVVKGNESSGVHAYLGTLNIDEVASAITPEGSLFPIMNHQGSTIALTDDAGTIRTEFSYDPFGRATVSGALSVFPFRFTGREDDGNGLYHYRARYYHPLLGRFLSEDPIGLAGGINLYVYALGNPIDLGDAFGFWPTVIHDELIDEAFPLLSEVERKALKLGSRHVDLDQLPRGAPTHAMRTPGQSAEEARRDMDAFINGRQRDAKKLQALCGSAQVQATAMRYHTSSLMAMGEALHPIMDSTSPTHKGFHVWSWGDIRRTLSGSSVHSAGESSITAAQRQETISLMRQAYEQFRRNAPCARGGF